MKTYLSIQYLRLLAALAVVAHHTLLTGPLGQAGVDVFFVISGFIMWLVTQRETRPATFLVHRAIRIWPLYLVASVVMALHQKAPVTNLVKSVLFIPHDNVAGKPWPVLTPGWTLNYEVFFYLIFAVVLLAPRKRQLALLAVALAGLSLVGLILRPDGPLAQTYTSTLLLEFLAGIGIGRLVLAGRLPGARVGLALVVAALLGFAGSTLMDIDNGNRALFWGVPGALLVLGGLAIESAGKLPRSAALKLLGDASYSIYLLHLFVLNAALKPLDHLPSVVPVAAVLGVAAAAGLAVYWLVERPVTARLRAWIEPWFPSRCVVPE